MVKLLDDNQLPYEQPGAGRHRRLQLSNVLEFRDRRRIERRLRLEEMTRQAGEDGLYNESAADYSDALDRTRHQG